MMSVFQFLSGAADTWGRVQASSIRPRSTMSRYSSRKMLKVGHSRPRLSLLRQKKTQVQTTQKYEFEYKNIKNLVNPHHIIFLKSRSFHFFKI